MADALPAKLMTGERLGRWTLLRFVPGARARWGCRCECGTERSVRHDALTKGDSRSCGCARTRVGGYFHQRSGTPTYSSWPSMKGRCLNPADPSFMDYGGRGIGVCERWQRSFVAFLEDMGERPSLDRQIERMDNEGDYRPGNCRWATVPEQALNKRSNRRVTAFGKTRAVVEWSRETGLEPNVIILRLRRGWRPEDALSRPVRPWRRPRDTARRAIA